MGAVLAMEIAQKRAVKQHFTTTATVLCARVLLTEWAVDDLAKVLGIATLTRGVPLFLTSRYVKVMPSYSPDSPLKRKGSISMMLTWQWIYSTVQSSRQGGT